MWRLAFCVAFAGCGFRSNGTAPDTGSVADAPTGDVPVAGDASADSLPTPICIQHWLDGSMSFGQPQLLPNLALTNIDDRDPWISADGLQLYFSSHRPTGSHGGYDVFVATRSSTADDFANPTPIEGVNTDKDENRPALSGDGMTMVYASNQNSGKAKIFVSTRTDAAAPFPSPSGSVQSLLDNVNMGFPGTTYYDPYLSGDGLRLYVAFIVGPNMQQIGVATRSAGQPFPALSTTVFDKNSVNSTSGEADPGPSSDERVIVYSSHRTDPNSVNILTNLWYATRQNTSDAFSAPKIIPIVNSSGEDGDPVLSADGCELYFASTRIAPSAPGGQYHLYKAVVQQ